MKTVCLLKFFWSFSWKVAVFLSQLSSVYLFFYMLYFQLLWLVQDFTYLWLFHWLLWQYMFFFWNSDHSNHVNMYILWRRCNKILVIPHWMFCSLRNSRWLCKLDYFREIRNTRENQDLHRLAVFAYRCHRWLDLFHRGKI